MATFEKRVQENKTVYRVKIRVKGYKNLSATFDRLTDAKTWAGKIESDMRTGRYIDVSENIKHTLNDLIDKYIKEKLPQRKTEQKAFKNRLLYWKKQIGNKLLRDITPRLIAEQRDILLNEPSIKSTVNHYARTGATVNRYLATLSIVLSKGVREWGWISENPMLKVDKCRENRGRTRFLSEEEQAKLLNACKESTTPLLYMLVVIALSTGARQGEILNLKWNNVKFNDDAQNVTLYFMNTKNGDNRNTTIYGLGYKLLKEHKESLPKVVSIDSKNYVFARPDGKKPYYIRRQWENALKKANITDFRFHDLRHTTASNLAMNGASLRDIGEILGHKTPAMTQRYSHLTEKYTTKVLKELNDKQFRNVEG